VFFDIHDNYYNYYNYIIVIIYSNYYNYNNYISIVYIPCEKFFGSFFVIFVNMCVKNKLELELRYHLLLFMIYDLFNNLTKSS